MRSRTYMLVALVLPGIALGQQIPDRAALDALLGTNQILEDFESFEIPAGHSTSLDVAVLDSACIANGQGPGLVAPGASYFAPGSNILQWNGDGWLDQATRTFFVTFTCGYLHVAYDPPVQALGFDVSGISPQGFAGHATFYDSGGAVVGSMPFAVDGAPGDRSFVGWRHEPGIALVVIQDMGDSWSPIVDDHGYGDLADPIGTNYCAPLPNSTGATGSIAAYGSAVATDDEVVLLATKLPGDVTGYVLNSTSSGHVPVGSGILCLGGSIGRHVKQVADSGRSGEILTALDLTALPRNGGPHVVMAGETWYFTLWHRDGPSSNFTDGVEITFQ